MKRMILVAVGLCVCCLGQVAAIADTIVVDPNGFADYTNIQEAINASWDGDTVLVKPGTYNSHFYFNGRAITLTSENPNDSNIVENTVITGGVSFDFGETSDSVITGFYIRTTGISCIGTSPTISKNIIKNNNGSGVYGGQPTITNNMITNNTASYGGGLYSCDGTITNNVIANNTANGDGGGLYRCDGTITNNVIANNTARDGGGLYRCDGTITNNVIANNTASDGGGLYDCDGTISNNIIAFNHASHEGGGLNYCSGNSYNGFFENTPENLANSAAGTGDMVRDPLFAGGSDYHLKSAAGRWTGTEWVLDGVSSPFIDLGDPSDSIGIEPNPNGGRINMGAYGGTAKASKSSSGVIEPVCTGYPVMDFNKDCKVDIVDFAQFANSWLECNLEPQSACWE